MSSKVAGIALIYHRQEIPQQREWWVVDRVTDSIEFRPGQELDKKTLETLCLSHSWKVTIKGANTNDS